MRQNAITGLSKKVGVLAALILLLLVPAARADPGFTLEGVKTWHWGDNTYIESVAVGDVDGDGSVEIVTGGPCHDGARYVAQLCVWTGSTLALEDVTTWHWVGNTIIFSVARTDVDGDGQQEIVTGGWYDDGTRDVAQLCVWKGATLSLIGVKTWYWTSHTRINSVACGDVDGDGQTEIITGGWYWDETRWVAQLCVWSGSLSLENVKTWYWTDDTYIYSVACGDVDGDGQAEIVTGGDYWDGTRYRAQLCVWDGSTLALEGVKTWYFVSDTKIHSVAVADVDGDKNVEIVTGGYYYDGTRYRAQLVVWDGGTLQGFRMWYWIDDTYIESVAVGDVDGDGSAEIVTGGYYDDVTGYRAQLAVWDGSTLALEGDTAWYWGSGTYIESVACGHVDGDGQQEIVTGGWYDDGTRDVAQLCVWGFT